MIKILCVVSSVCVCHVSQTHEALTGAWAPTRRGAGVGAFTSQERSFVWNKHYERSRTTFQWSKDGIQNGWRQLSRLDLFISSDNGWLLLCWTDLNTAIEESWCLCAWVDYVLSSIVSLQCIHGILLLNPVGLKGNSKSLSASNSNVSNMSQVEMLRPHHSPSEPVCEQTPWAGENESEFDMEMKAPSLWPLASNSLPDLQKYMKLAWSKFSPQFKSSAIYLNRALTQWLETTEPALRSEICL